MPKQVRDIMSKDIVTVKPSTTMTDLQNRFANARFGALPVVDRDDKLRGIVSRTDVVRKFSLEQSLAELAEFGFETVSDEADDATEANALDAISSAVGRRLSKMFASDVMISDVITIAPDADTHEAARLMVANRIHRLPVVEDGKLVGIVSAFDFMSHYVSSSS